jgi:hypothetical protein
MAGRDGRRRIEGDSYQEGLMSSYTHPVPHAVPQVARHLGWFALVCAVAFLVPYLGVSVFALQHDVFYLAYFAITLTVIASYVRVEHVAVADMFRVRWRWSLGIGLLLSVFLVFNVVRTEDATARPHGAYFVFELAWRGVGYALVDTLLLTVFPCLIAYTLLRGKVAGLTGRLRFAALALPLVMIVTATYHIGYPQYRQDGISRPETGNVLISIPAFVTANPVGSFVAHVSQHVAAVTHAYGSGFSLPVWWATAFMTWSTAG